MSTCKIADPTGGGACFTGAVKLSAHDKQVLAAKTKLASEFAAVRAGKLSAASYNRDFSAFIATYHLKTPAAVTITPNCVSGPGGGCVPSSKTINSLVQQAQINNYYCGPATASEILGALGITDSQSTLASNAILETNEYGQTPWTDNTGASPMKNALDNLQNSNYYAPVNGSGVGGGFNESTYTYDLQYDIAYGWPIAGNVVENAGQVHLTGHPSSQTIYHWIAIYGYSNYGNGTSYADSVHGSVIGWPAPAYNTGFSSSDMTTLLNGRGFVW